jgi:hypothetical protein
VGKEVMYTMNRALQESAIGYAGTGAFAAGGRAVAAPAAAAPTNNLILIIIVVIIICACSGFGADPGVDHCGRRRRRRRAGGIRIGGNALLFIILAFLFTGASGGGRNINTNVVNVSPTDVGAEDDFIDL